MNFAGVNCIPAVMARPISYMTDGNASRWVLVISEIWRSAGWDSLLYLAESMRQLRDTNRSCIALGEFATNFPREAAGRLKGQYDATRAGVKCN